MPSSKPQRNHVGAAIARLREERSMSQNDLIVLLADHGISMTVPTISKIENHTRGVNDIELLAFSRIFGVSIDDLFS